MNRESLVSVRNLHRRFGSLHAVKGVSFELHRGEVLGLLGPNGAGKTTTMQMICGALAPTSGEILIDGDDLLNAPRQTKGKIGYLPERPPLYGELSVDEYLFYCARLRHVARSRAGAAVDHAKSRCGLGQTGGRLIANLSKGYQQRVGVAQAIVHSPAVVILDEPTVGLDPIQIRQIRDLIGELRDDHAVILSTHILPEVQMVCDRVQILNEGRIVLDERLDALDRASTGLRVAFRRPPGNEVLESLPQVTAVVPVEGGRLRLEHEPNAELPDTLVVRSAAGDWGLYEMIPEHHGLEEIFVSLTCGEVESAATPEAVVTQQ
jgi:ABC-2 type transport system ATP-binding protein